MATKTSTSKKTGGDIDFARIKREARERAELLLHEAEQRPISPAANPALLSAMYSSIIVQQHEYLISLLIELLHRDEDV